MFPSPTQCPCETVSSWWSSRNSTPINQKGAAFIFSYQAVTSENESKVRVFSLFPQPPPVHLTAVAYWSRQYYSQQINFFALSENSCVWQALPNCYVHLPGLNRWPPGKCWKSCPHVCGLTFCYCTRLRWTITCCILDRAIPQHQTKEDVTTASANHFSHEFLAIATDNSHYAELSATTLSQCSGTNRLKLCPKRYSTTTDETLIWLTSLFHEYSIQALRNCLVALSCCLRPHMLHFYLMVLITSNIVLHAYRLKTTPIICIQIHLAVSSLSYSTQLFVNTHLQTWRFCSYTPHVLLWNSTRAVRCICRTHPFFGCKH